MHRFGNTVSKLSHYTCINFIFKVLEYVQNYHLNRFNNSAKKDNLLSIPKLLQ
ncbi:hypothetical protein HMPREF0619_03840 [Parabacteroides sp. D13]|nr:hypothetical protein HMPREF0619_03840 [Parabacteroides sp. D13]KDS59607.1 hypothetical protein M095_4056 [Parabacteroides distasonis str. 3999B T(B) 4]KDS65671.1 hypothetical protein M096_4582 [Parabacteroides distasonis str. 3999B T(B) 6]